MVEDGPKTEASLKDVPLDNQAWLLKNSLFLKTAKIWGIENV